jgi:hypothetical protein
MGFNSKGIDDAAPRIEAYHQRRLDGTSDAAKARPSLSHARVSDSVRLGSWRTPMVPLSAAQAVNAYRPFHASHGLFSWHCSRTDFADRHATKPDMHEHVVVAFALLTCASVAPRRLERQR